MIPFFVKKAFFDGWDNFLMIFIMNMCYSLFTIGAMLLTIYLGGISGLFAFLSMVLILLILSVSFGGVSGVVLNYSDYRGETWNAFRSSVVRNIGHSILFFFVLLFLLLNASFFIPFYMRNFGIPGKIVSVVLIWIEIIFFVSIPYYFPLMNLLPADRPLKTAKKCLVILVDNLGFTVFLTLYNIFCLILSVFTFGIIPGISGMMLASQDAMKLRMYKYDYLETVERDGSKIYIPWYELLAEEREKVGPRSIKSMILPWK